MLKVLPVSLAVFLLILCGIYTLPGHSPAAVALDGMGRAIIALSEQFAEIVQLPLTVPMAVFGHQGSLASVEEAALRDRTIWAGALVIWTILGLLAFESSRRSEQRLVGNAFRRV